MARGLALLFGAGATLVLVTLLLPHSSNTDELGTAVPPLVAYVACAALLALGPRMPVWATQVVLALGTALISGCVVFGGDNASAYPLMYVWVTLYAGWFFSAPAAALHVLNCAACYVGALQLEDATRVPSVHWLMAIGTAGVAATLMSIVAGRVRRQASDLEAVARVANGQTIMDDPGPSVCVGLRDAVRADAVVLVEAQDDGLRVAGRAEDPYTGGVLDRPGATEAALAALADGRTQPILGTRAGRRRGDVVGLAEPGLRDGRPAAVLALVWGKPRRRLDDHVRTAALLFAAQASVALERAERLSAERERQALELNDSIVQGLAVAKYAMSTGRTQEGLDAIDDTLARARELITDQLEEVVRVRGELRPGDLVRSDAPVIHSDRRADSRRRRRG